jgi:hypothetical protein
MMNRFNTSVVALTVIAEMFMNAVPGIRLIQTLLIRISWSALTMGLILGVLI